MKTPRLILTANNTPTTLTPDTQIPLEMPIVLANTMTPFGHMIINEFHAAVDGFFRFNVSSQGERVDNYAVHIVDVARDVPHIHFNTGPSESKLCAQKDVTLKLNAGDVVKLYDYVAGGSGVAFRTGYANTNRIEITLED